MSELVCWVGKGLNGGAAGLLNIVCLVNVSMNARDFCIICWPCCEASEAFLLNFSLKPSIWNIDCGSLSLESFFGRFCNSLHSVICTPLSSNNAPIVFRLFALNFDPLLAVSWASETDFFKFPPSFKSFSLIPIGANVVSSSSVVVLAALVGFVCTIFACNWERLKLVYMIAIHARNVQIV